ncbi:MAG TPA: heterodisulfide reductase-related iron-sulfur binding cluster, partial [Thermoanaerobaculia bacterium]|nr:heterodisulfide reductase-related iron-sulfur binding cluster [Thermoanaerobaculia bacterium]
MYEISDPSYFDPAALDTELRRVFDVCHGCRMCFNYCPSFPSLFDAIDRHEEKGEGEVAALTAQEIDEVVDLCYQCKLCYVKCPYTPPHKFAIDFPRLLFRAKLATVRKEGVKFRERILGDPDRLGRLSSGPLAAFVNWANRQPLLRAMTEKALGIHRKRLLPRFARVTFAKWLKNVGRASARPDAEPVVLFETCTVNYNRPEVGVAAVQVLEHNRKRIERPDLVCCGMPAMDGGDLETAKAKIAHNVAELAPLVRRGMKIVALGPSCGMMMKSEWPQLVPTDDCRLVSAATMDIGEYLAKEKAAGRLRTDFTVPQGSVAYHVPCHLRAQNIGAPFKGIFESMPGTKVEPIEQCSAFDGTWGMKTEFYDLSRKCAGKLCKSVERCNADCVASDCLLAGINVTEETG